MSKSMIQGFVSGKFSGPNAYEIENNVRICEDQCLILAQYGFSPVCLNVIGRYLAGTMSYEFWLNCALDQIRRSDFLFLCLNWEMSNGAVKEKAYAESIGIPVFDNISDLLNWREALGDRI